MSGDVLTPADLPTLRRMVAHFRARAAHRGIAGRVACYFLAAICDRMIHGVINNGELRPEIDYHRAGKS